jgi:2-hydroxychromene-2-carboxylate isomerase
MKNYATAVWSQRVFSDSGNGLKHIVEKSDLDWQKAQSMLNNQSWREWADTNLKELFDLGLWGVPSFKYKDTRVFGQDKLLFVEQAIRKTCR